MITGRACTRIMSGYQKNKADEAKILESLREEGLLVINNTNNLYIFDTEIDHW